MLRVIIVASDLVFPFFLSLSPPSFPDPLHAYLGLCGLSLIGEPSLRKVHPALNITQRAFEHLQQLQQTWRASTGSCSRQHWQSAPRPPSRLGNSGPKKATGLWAPRLRRASSFQDSRRCFWGSCYSPEPLFKSIWSDFSVKQYMPHFFFAAFLSVDCSKWCASRLLWE